MLLSPNGILEILAAFSNILMAASFLDIGTENTRKFSGHPLVKILFLFSFGVSVVPTNKLAVLVAVGLFFVLEIKNFVTDTSSTASNLLKNTISSTENFVDDVTN